MSRRQKTVMQSNNGSNLTDIYGRVSSAAQEDNTSLEGQVNSCMGYCARNGLEVVNVYTDVISGDIPLDARPEGKKLLMDIKNNAVSNVVIYTQDRMSRNLAHTLVIRQQCNAHSVNLHFVDKGRALENTAEAKLMSNMEAMIGEYEREKIRMRTAKGREDKINEDGKWLGIHTPYGYRREGRGREAQIFIDDAEHGNTTYWAKWIWDAYTIGHGPGPMTTGQIARELNARGVPAPKGGKWIRTSVLNMLHEEIYMGVIYYGKTRLCPKEYDTQPAWEREEAVPKEEWKRKDFPHLAVITEKTYNMAQERMQRNKDLSYAQARGKYLLSGFLRCPHCGRKMGGSRKRIKKAVYTFYMCSNVDCAYKGYIITQNVMDSLVWEWLKAELNDTDKLLAGLDRLERRENSEIDEKKERLEIANKLIVERNNELVNLVTLQGQAPSTIVANAYNQRIEMVAKELQSLQNEQDQLSRQVKKVIFGQVFRQRLVASAKALSAKMEVEAPVEQKRMLLDMLHFRVDFYRSERPRRVEIFWALSEDENPAAVAEEMSTGCSMNKTITSIVTSVVMIVQTTGHRKGS